MIAAEITWWWTARVKLNCKRSDCRFSTVCAHSRDTRFSSPSHAVSLSTTCVSKGNPLARLLSSERTHYTYMRPSGRLQCAGRVEMKSPRMTHFDYDCYSRGICLRRRAEKKKLLVKAGAVSLDVICNFAVWKSHLIRIKQFASWWKWFCISHAHMCDLNAETSKLLFLS